MLLRPADHYSPTPTRQNSSVVLYRECGRPPAHTNKTKYALEVTIYPVSGVKNSTFYAAATATTAPDTDTEAADDDEHHDAAAAAAAEDDGDDDELLVIDQQSPHYDGRFRRLPLKKRCAPPASHHLLHIHTRTHLYTLVQTVSSALSHTHTQSQHALGSCSCNRGWLRRLNLLKGAQKASTAHARYSSILQS